jgi:hypothetical protein
MRTSRLFLAPLLAAAVLAAACSGGTNPLEPQGSGVSLPPPPTGNPEVSAGLLSGLLGKSYLSCTSLPAAKKSATIGLLGGSISVGPHKIIFPPASVLKSTKITAEITAGDKTNSIKFSPEGLKFKVPAVITISYANCKYGGLLSLLRLAYTSNDLKSILEILPAIPNPLNKTVLGTITHFSRYAVAY